MREDWIECTIKDISKIINGDRGKNYPSRTHYVSNGLPFVSAGNINDSNKLEKNSLNFISQERFDLLKGGFLKQGDILFCIRGSLGKLAIYDLDIDGAIASSLVIVRRLKSVEEKYLLYYLSSFSIKLFINEFNNGTAQPNLSAKDFSNFKFPLPPIPEQRAIVKKLESLFSSLDAGVADLKKAQQQLKIYRQGVLKKAFEGELTKKVVKNCLPESWKTVKIVDLVDKDKNALKAGPFGSSLKKEFYKDTGYKIYGQEQVINNNPYFGNYYVDEQKYNELYSCRVKPNDILISLVGTVGKVLLLPNDCLPGIINPRLVKITLDLNKYLPSFFKYYFESAFVKSFYSGETRGTTMDVLNLGIIKTIPFPLPPIEEQHQIVKQIESRLSVCDSIEQNIKESLSKAEALRQSILKKAFEGNLLTAQELAECKQAVDYEPASVLLERIKAEQKSPADNTDKRRKKAK